LDANAILLFRHRLLIPSVGVGVIDLGIDVFVDVADIEIFVEVISGSEFRVFCKIAHDKMAGRKMIREIAIILIGDGWDCSMMIAPV
jgi:hypothetical protein